MPAICKACAPKNRNAASATNPMTTSVCVLMRNCQNRCIGKTRSCGDRVCGNGQTVKRSDYGFRDVGSDDDDGALETILIGQAKSRACLRRDGMMRQRQGR